MLFIHRRGINLEVQVLLTESATVITYICCHMASHITMVIYLSEYTCTDSCKKIFKNFPSIEVNTWIYRPLNIY